MDEKIYNNLNDYVKEVIERSGRTANVGFNLDTGAFHGIGVSLMSPDCTFITPDCYPVYNENDEYLGHYSNKLFVPKGHDVSDIQKMKFLENEVEELRKEIEELRERIREDCFVH
jgi:hypothetical protein